jgi:endo-1,3(4)-beta-glucanase
MPWTNSRRHNLGLAIEARALLHYYLYETNNSTQPSKFIGNRAAGILFENKCDHTTFFGTNIEYIQGIHMLPLIPSTPYTRPATFVSEEWSTYFDKGRVDKIVGGWKGVLYGNLIIVDAKTAWNFFSQPKFDPSWLDNGASLTWYLAYAAGECSAQMTRKGISC